MTQFDLTTKLDKVIIQEHGNCEDKLMLNHDLLESTDDQKEQACINESRKRSSHHGNNVNQESEKRQEFKIGKSWKTSRKRTLIEQNDRKGLGVSSQARRCIKRAPDLQGRSHSEIEKGTRVKSPSGVQDPNSTQNDHLSGHNPSCAILLVPTNMHNLVQHPLFIYFYGWLPLSF
jgi:hypothetical protein